MNVILFVMTMLFGVLPCVVFGYLIKYRGMHYLIAGYEEGSVNDAAMFGARIGNTLFFTAMLVFALYLDIEYHSDLSVLGWVIVVLVCIAPVVLAFRAVRLDAKGI